MTTKSNNKETKIKDIFNKIQTGVTNIIESGEYAKFLKFSKNFHSYSFNNIVLIYSQMPNATKVAGFKTWQSMGRKLKYGSKGIQIIYPIKRKYEKNTTIEGQNSLLNSDEKEKKQTIEYLTYRATYVYDISQTVGESLPMEDDKINTNNNIELFNYLKSFSPFPIKEIEIFGSTQGYWSPKGKYIALKKDLSIDDKVATLLHELTHALYDDFDYKKDRNLSETFVESVAYIVADYFNLDTSICSFNYITSYVKDDIKILMELGDKIQKTANKFIKSLEDDINNRNIRIAV
ncbi:MAG TPA: hypothetical protein DER15_02795 [Clostridiales bacterium]|nr:hypothetical protein [Clostridiales bacterium]